MKKGCFLQSWYNWFKFFNQTRACTNYIKGVKHDFALSFKRIQCTDSSHSLTTHFSNNPTSDQKQSSEIRSISRRLMWERLKLTRKKLGRLKRGDDEGKEVEPWERNEKVEEDEKKKQLVFVAVPRTTLAGLQSTVTALPCTDYMTKVLDSLLSA